MSKRTYNPAVLNSADNFTLPQIQQISKGLDFPDTVWMLYDGSNQANLWVIFPQTFTPPAVGANKQRLRARVRKNATGGNDVVVRFNLRQENILIATLQAGVTITDTTEQLFTFLFDASILNRADGFGIGLEIDQTAGGTGPVANRRGFDVNAIDLTYEDDVGTQRLVKTRLCDGACCIAAPRWPLGAGTIEDPHQGSDCEKRTPPDGKEIGGCTLFEDESLRPAVGVKSALKGMATIDELDLFLDTCFLWPQNTIAGDPNLGGCCWLWEDDV